MQYGLLIFLSSCLVVVMIYSMDLIKHYNDLNLKTIEISKQLLLLQKIERDFAAQDVLSETFHATGYSQNVRTFDSLLADERYKIGVIENEDLIKDIHYADSLKYVVEQLDRYNIVFRSFVSAYKQKGFKDWGQEGKIRTSIHAIEKSGLHFNALLMLTLRRHEKDFLLRKDTAYVIKFNQTVIPFRDSFLPSEYMVLNAQLNKYTSAFHAIVNTELKIGVNNEHGLRKELASTFNSTEPVLNRLSDKVNKHASEIVRKTYFVLAIVFVVQLIIALILAFAFSYALTKAIKRLFTRIKKLSEGQFPDKIVVNTNDELAQTSLAFNNLMERIKVASYFANKIGQGEYNITYPKEFSNDVLSDALQGMQNLLKKSNDEKEMRNWINAGLNDFNLILQQDDDNIERISKKILTKLVKHVNAIQAQLFYKKSGDLHSNSEYLELTATYALDQFLDLNIRVEKGEGLIGEVWKQREKQYIVNVPDTFLKVSSGMGESPPCSALIVPLIYNKEVEGVIEIDSFGTFNDYSIELVEKLAELMANWIIRHNRQLLVY